LNTVPSGCAAADPRVLATFRALVEAIVPNTPALAVYGPWQTCGAADLCIHEYMIWELDHSLSIVSGLNLTIMPLSASTAGMLNAAAVQFIAKRQAQYAPCYPVREVSLFASLSPADRIRVLEMLEELKVDLGVLPLPIPESPQLEEDDLVCCSGHFYLCVNSARCYTSFHSLFAKLLGAGRYARQYAWSSPAPAHRRKVETAEKSGTGGAGG